MRVQYLSKNHGCLLETGRTKVKTTQSYFSYSNCLRRRKYAAVMGKLHEIAAFSKPASLIPRGVMMVVPDFMEAQFPFSVVSSAVCKMAAMSVVNRSIWMNTRQLVQLMYQVMHPFTVQRVQQQQACFRVGG